VIKVKNFLAIFVCLLSNSLFAAFSNPNSILIGDQASGMSGAYTSMSGDVSASGFYNPAGLAFLTGSSFSGSVAVYKKYDSVYGEEEDFTKASLRVGQGFFRSLPSSIGNHHRFKDFTFGLSIVNPDYSSFRGDIKKNDTEQSALQISDESLWVGGSLAYLIDDSQSIGLTTYYTSRNYSRTVNNRSQPSATRSVFYNSDQSLSENAIVAILGYQKILNSSWRLGLSIRAPSVRLYGMGNFFSYEVDTEPFSQKNINYNEVSTNVRIPARLALGVNYKWNDDLQFSYDITFYEGFSVQEMNKDELPFRVEYRPISNGALGVEYKLLKHFLVRVGGFTNFSAHKTLNENLNERQSDKIDQLGFSANASYVSPTHGGTYTFGGYFTGGRGKSSQYFNGNWQVVGVTQQVFTMILATSFKF
jgi:long-subunit fatty acid transport protein